MQRLFSNGGIWGISGKTRNGLDWLIVFFGILTQLCVAAAGKLEIQTGTQLEISGIIVDRDADTISVRNNDGDKSVRLTKATQVALSTNYRQIGDVQNDTITYNVLISNQVIPIKLSPGPKYATKSIRPRQAAQSRASALKEKWISARNLNIYSKPIADNLPSPETPYFAGQFTFARGRGKPAVLKIGDRSLDVSMKKGGQTNVLVYDVYTIDDCQPHLFAATVVGRESNKAIVADEIHLTPIGGQTIGDDPRLPRLLVIGDSISINYYRSLCEALKGKYNVHHPPTNCGPSGKGAGNVVKWLGAHRTRGRHWDVITFNFGHWDAGNTREKYQENLEFVISKLKASGAKLIWVTTCPVPDGVDPAGESIGEKAPGRKAGVMERYLNPWAYEVMKLHPEIAICDQWQHVKDNNGGSYTQWWKGKNVHFSGQAAIELGRLLAEQVVNVGDKEVIDSPEQVTLRLSLKLDPNVYEKSHYKKPPQFAVWLEKVPEGTIRTVWVTEKTGTGGWGRDITRSVSLPYWVSRWNLETQSRSFPTPENPATDAVTGATPKVDFIAETTVPAKSVWSYFIEVNVSGDYNDAFPVAQKDGQRDRQGNGQPSIIYKGQITSSPGQRSIPRLIGRTEQLQGVRHIITDVEGITTAKNLFSIITVSCHLPQ
jgi:lysophospholipase L1-like esterase